MRLLIVYRKHNRATWIPLLAALEDADLLARIEWRLIAPDKAAEEFEAAHEGGETVVLAMTVKTQDMPWASETTRQLAPFKRPGDLILAGGPHPTARPREMLDAGIDAVVAGEGEIAFADLMGRLLDGRDWRGAPNLRFLDGPRMIENAAAPPIDLDRTRSCLRNHRLTSPMEITRGCRWGCRYCQTPQMWHGGERHRSIESAARLAESYRVFIQFLTPNALGYQSAAPGRPNVKALVGLLETIKTRRPGLRLNFGNFPSEVRPDYVTAEAAKAVRPLCDNRVMAVGAQSGSPRVLRTIGRGHTVEDVYRAVENLQAAGFVAYVDVIFGLPGEVEDDAAMTRRLVRDLARMNARVRGHVFLPLPGSPFENTAPAAISPETRELLAALEAAGAADGEWRRQMRNT